MSEQMVESTFSMEASLHRALCAKAEVTHRSMSDLVNDAVRLALLEDEEDEAAFDLHGQEPTITHQELLEDLRVHGKL